MRNDTHLGQLARHVKKNLSKGYKIDALRVALLNQGYSKIEINKAIDIANKEIEEQKIVKNKERPKIVYQLFDQDENPIQTFTNKKSFWKRIF